MTLFAFELNDAAIAAVGPAGVVLADPGYVPGVATDIDSHVLFGDEAWRQSRLHPRSTTNRYWREFSELPGARPFGPYSSSADLVHAHLEALISSLPERPSGVVLVVPPYWSTNQLGLLLGLAEELALPVRALVDSAVAATRCEYPDQRLIHLDASLHDVTITHLHQDGQVALHERQSVENLGVSNIERTCAVAIANRFLRATRFDPAHDAGSEQFLYDQLYGWLRELNRQEEIGVAIEFRGNEFATTLRRDELAGFVADAFEPVTQHIRSSIAAGDRVVLQVTHRLAEFPGVIDVLTSLPQVTVVVLDPAAAALGALQRCERFAPAEAGIGLSTRLPWDRAATAPSSTDSLPERSREHAEPTHLLHDGLVYRLGAAPFNVGAELATGEAGLRLSPALSGVSRRHCSLRRGTHGLELVDHSRFGTQLNGHAIDGAVIVQAGDVITIGRPEVSLHLVREIESQEANGGA